MGLVEEINCVKQTKRAQFCIHYCKQDVETSSVSVVKYSETKRKPGAVRDAILDALAYRPRGATVAEIAHEVSTRIGETPASSIRSYLRLNTPKLFTKVDRGHYVVREEAQATLAFSEQNGHRTKPSAPARAAFCFGNATLIHEDCFTWLAQAAVLKLL